jgi:uncharacterized protein (TIGR03437 family)
VSRLTVTALLLTLSRTVFAAIQITSSPILPSGKVGQPYSFTFTGSGATNGAWGVAAGAPPQGLTLAPSSGTLSGVPQGGGFYSFQVVLNGANGDTATQIVTAQFASLLSLIIDTPALQEGIVGQTLSLPPVTGGAPPYKWSLQSGALPPGLSLDPNGTTVDGSYTTPGTFNFTLLVTDSTGATLFVPVTLPVIVSPPKFAGNFPTLRQGLAYDFQIVVTGGLPPFHFQTTNLYGLSVDSTGRATGIASPSGPTSLIFTDATGATIYLPVTLPVAPPGMPVDGGAMSTLAQSPFTFYLPVPGGNPPFSWSGQLPPGVSLDPTDGVLQGIIDQPTTLSVPITSTNGAGQQETTTYSLTVTPNPLTILTSSLDPVFATQDISSQIQLSGAQGTPTIIVDAEGNYGQVGLSSLVPGTYQATITATDSAGNRAQKNVPLVVAPSALQFGASNLVGVASGSTFPQKVQAVGGTPPYTFSAPDPAMLPPAISLDAFGNLTGTYTVPGNYAFPIQVTDSAGTSAYQVFDISIGGGGEFLAPLPSAVVGAPYAGSFLGPYAPPGPYSCQLPEGLPQGLTCDAAGTIRGLPLVTGVYQFWINAISGQGEPASLLQTFVIGPNPALASRGLPNAQVGTAYSMVLPTTLTNVSSWTAGPASLPSGMKFDPTTGMLSGTPSAPGLYGLVATAANQAATDAAVYTFYVVSASSLTISPAVLPPLATQNQQNTLSVSGGVPPYQWAITSGAGYLGADPYSGYAELTDATSPITVQVTDSTGRTGTTTYTVVPLDDPTVATPPSPIQGAVGTPLSYQLQVTGGIPPYSFTQPTVPGLVITPTGLLTGVPQQAGTFTLGAQFTNAGGTFGNPVSVPMVIQPQPFAVATQKLFNGHPGFAYVCPLLASGGTPPYQWSATGLPAGLKLSALGIIFGVPAQAQSAPVLVTVQDSTGNTATASLALFIDPTVPAISPGGVTSAASYQNAAVSPAEIITIFGSALGPQALQLNRPVNGAFPTELAQTQVLINGTPAPLIYVSDSQAAAVTPASLAGQQASTITVVRNGIASAPATVFVNAVTPGVFTLDASGTGAAAMLNQDETVNSKTNPAASGSVVSVFVTGTGATVPGLPDGSLAPLNPPFPVPATLPGASVDGLPAQVLYAGPAPGEIYGLTQINVQLPSNLPAGAVPVTITQIPAIPAFRSQTDTVIWVR